jgi:hypothetical protein
MSVSAFSRLESPGSITLADRRRTQTEPSSVQNGAKTAQSAESRRTIAKGPGKFCAIDEIKKIKKIWYQ